MAPRVHPHVGRAEQFRARFKLGPQLEEDRLKPYDAPSGSVWWFCHRDIVDVFVVLDGFVQGEDETTHRRIFVLHSDDEASTQMGQYSVGVGSPYNDASTRFA